MPEDQELPPTYAEALALKNLRLALMEYAPIELIIYWCSVCNSTFIHNVGSRHIPQSIGKGNHVCEGTLIPLQFVR